jgi:high affinity Mn2+ porin
MTDRRLSALWLIMVAGPVVPGMCIAQTSFPTTERASTTQPASAPAAPEPFSVHAQATVISQEHDAFHAPYAGLRSLPRHEGWKTSMTGTLFLGARLWQGAEGYFDPEVAGGEGFGGVAGIAGFPNGEIPRVGTPEPEPYVARLYLRQDFGFGGDREKIDPGPNALAGWRDVDRLSLYLGRFAVSDFFDNNTYSHDPRGQFENWALMANGAWDYPADTRGYAYGFVAELNQPTWTLRYGAVTEPKIANGGTIDWNVPKALGQVIEYEQRWKIADHPGVARPMAYFNMAHMGNYHQAVANPGPNGPDVTLSRTYSVKYGLGLNAEQEIADGIGVFGRLGWNDGRTETWAFTEIDQTISAGLSFNGKRWNRPDDVFGIAGVMNGCQKNIAPTWEMAVTDSSSATASCLTTPPSRSSRRITCGRWPTIFLSRPMRNLSIIRPITPTADRFLSAVCGCILSSNSKKRYLR